MPLMKTGCIFPLAIMVDHHQLLPVVPSLTGQEDRLKLRMRLNHHLVIVKDLTFRWKLVLLLEVLQMNWESQLRSMKHGNTYSALFC